MLPGAPNPVVVPKEDPVVPKLEPVVPKAPVVAPNAEGAAAAVGAPNAKDEGFAAAPNVDPNAEGAAAAGAPNPMKKINHYGVSN